MAAMRIRVLGEESISAQARTYAEYRMFAALARSAEKVRGARVLLRTIDGRRRCPRVVCEVTIDFEGIASLRIRTTGSHAYESINRAVGRVRIAAESARGEAMSS